MFPVRWVSRPSPGGGCGRRCFWPARSSWRLGFWAPASSARISALGLFVGTSLISVAMLALALGYLVGRTNRGSLAIAAVVLRRVVSRGRRGRGDCVVERARDGAWLEIRSERRFPVRRHLSVAAAVVAAGHGLADRRPPGSGRGGAIRSFGWPDPRHSHGRGGRRGRARRVSAAAVIPGPHGPRDPRGNIGRRRGPRQRPRSQKTAIHPAAADFSRGDRPDVAQAEA